MTSNPFGHFDAGGRAFVITDPGTPSPWVNVICNGRYGLVVSQNGGGFSWLDNSQLNVLTRWEMDLVRDRWGKFLYLRDLETEDVWSASPMPCRARFDRYSCTHTTGATTFRTEYAGISATWTLTVAPDDPVEIWRVELTNTTARERRLRIASFFEWCCGVAPDAKREFHRLFFTTRYDAARRAVFASKNMWDVPARDEKDHWNRPWPYVAAHAVGGLAFERDVAISDKSAFLGRYGEQDCPEAMAADRPPSPAGFGRFNDASVSLGGDFRIAAGGTVRLHYLTACAETDAAVHELIDRYNTASAVDAAVGAADAAWANRLAPTSVRTEMPDLDLLNNHWLPYQAISGRLWARTGYYQQSGAFGFRDQLQDSQVWLPLEPARCRAQILQHSAHQFADGSVYHWWHPLTETGLRTMCSDDYLWLPFITISYLKETGDFQILDEQAPFVDVKAPAPLLEHCLRAFARCFQRFSPRGLPLIGSCDWNDGLSACGIEGRGESVWLAQFLAAMLDDFAVVLERAGRAVLAREFRERRERIARAVNEHAWNGSWYRRATRDDGRWVGDVDSSEGKIYLNAQTWAILSGVAPADRAAAAWQAVQEHLLGDMGPLLLAPAYTVPDRDVGYITRYTPGLRENGGVYMHAATWALMAACMMRDTSTAERIWRAISPPLRGEDAEAYVAEPYVTPGNVDGPLSQTPGKAGWTWYTGSAAWLNRVCLQHLFGIRPTWDGLVVEPAPFPSMGRVDVTRTWRGCPVRVRFDAREFKAGAAARLVVNGKTIDGHTVPAETARAGMPISIEVSWGNNAGTAEAAAVAAGRTYR
ncbi:MAG: hypothetical protein KF745_00075 [Phycisphaeraceae bacterium]|nr:hypothetical protein [Phycisphaeraceae bacterium]